MKIAFADTSPTDYRADTPYRRPLGGTQSAAAYLSAALAARGHTVTLMSNTREPGTVLGVDSPGRSHSNAAVLNTYDAVVVLTDPVGQRMQRGGFTAPRVLWQHKAAGLQSLKALDAPEERAAWDAVVYVSETQQRAFKARYGLDGPVIRNAISPSMLAQPIDTPAFTERTDGPCLIYASAPGRGLDLLLTLFPTIRKAVPDARLRVFSDLGLYQWDDKSSGFEVYYELARALPGVEFVGSVDQATLAQAMSQADVFAYPTTFEETSCIVLMEAAAAGCILVATELGALPETAAGFARIVPMTNARAGLAQSVAQETIAALQAAIADPQAFQKTRRAQMDAFRTAHSWDQRAAEWESLLETLVRR